MATSRFLVGIVCNEHHAAEADNKKGVSADVFTRCRINDAMDIWFIASHSTNSESHFRKDDDGHMGGPQFSLS